MNDRQFDLLNAIREIIKVPDQSFNIKETARLIGMNGAVIDANFEALINGGYCRQLESNVGQLTAKAFPPTMKVGSDELKASQARMAQVLKDVGEKAKNSDPDLLAAGLEAHERIQRENDAWKVHATAMQPVQATGGLSSMQEQLLNAIYDQVGMANKSFEFPAIAKGQGMDDADVLPTFTAIVQAGFAHQLRRNVGRLTDAGINHVQTMRSLNTIGQSLEKLGHHIAVRTGTMPTVPDFYELPKGLQERISELHDLKNNLSKPILKPGETVGSIKKALNESKDDAAPAKNPWRHVKKIGWLFSEVPSTGKKYLASGFWLALLLVIALLGNHYFHWGMPTDTILERIKFWK